MRNVPLENITKQLEKLQDSTQGSTFESDHPNADKITFDVKFRDTTFKFLCPLYKGAHTLIDPKNRGSFATAMNGRKTFASKIRAKKLACLNKAMALFDKFKQLDMEECKNWLMLGIDDLNIFENLTEAEQKEIRKAEEERKKAEEEARKREAEDWMLAKGVDEWDAWRARKKEIRKAMGLKKPQAKVNVDYLKSCFEEIEKMRSEEEENEVVEDLSDLSLVEDEAEEAEEEEEEDA